MNELDRDMVLQKIKDGVSVTFPIITRDDVLVAIENGIKDALLTAMESGDGYSGPIIREPILRAIEQGTHSAIVMLND